MILLLLAGTLSYANCALNSTKTTEILKQIDRRTSILAPRKKGEIFSVSLAVHILNMVPLSFINDHIHVEMDIIATWKDRRLQYESESPNDKIVLQGSGNMSIWRPDIVIDAEKGVEYETFPGTLAAYWIAPSGNVAFFQRLSVTVSCPMSVVFFPFDKQSCPLSFESYTYNTSQLYLKFLNLSGLPTVSFSNSFRISKFILEKYTVEKRTIDYGLAGFFDQLRINFFLKRDIRFYIMQYYFPIICAVFLSFISFWIAHESTPARVSLPVTTFLTLATMLDHIRTSSGYFGAADSLEIFLNVSIFFVFGVMFEYGIVEAVTLNFEENIEDHKRDDEREASKTGQRLLSICQYLNTIKTFLRNATVRSSDGSISLDRFCRYVFPFGYFSFLLTYFTICFVNLNGK